jgi:glutaredoxin
MAKGMYTLVGRVDCPHCSKAMGLLRDKGCTVNYYSLNDSKWVLDLFKKSGIKTVPQIWDQSGNCIGGYQELKQLLERE